jgi:hypothetical protein
VEDPRVVTWAEMDDGFRFNNFPSMSLDKYYLLWEQDRWYFFHFNSAVKNQKEGRLGSKLMSKICEDKAEECACTTPAPPRTSQVRST